MPIIPVRKRQRQEEEDTDTEEDVSCPNKPTQPWCEGAEASLRTGTNMEFLKVDLG